MADVIGKQEKVDRLLNLLGHLLTIFALFSAFAAMLFACLWFITSWYTPDENYSELKEIRTKGGQYLMIEYPKSVLANNKPADLILSLNGPIQRDKSVDIIFPSEMRILGFEENASRRKVTGKFTDANTNGRVIKITFFHSKTVTGPWWFCFSNQTVTISSSDLSLDPFNINVKMETDSWARVREFVNSSVGDKSPLILLVSGLISWAGTYLLQLRKDKREQKKEAKQEEREKKELAKKNNEELWEGLKSDPVQTIKNFADQVKEESTTSLATLVAKKFQNEFRVLKLKDWRNLLFKQVLAYWHDEDTGGASELIEVMIFLEESFLEKNQESTEVLLQINKLISTEETDFQSKDAESILNAYKCWRNPCKPILQKILVKYIQPPENLGVIAKLFKEEKDLGYPILRASKINSLLRQYEASQLSEGEKEALMDLNWLLGSGIYWRPLWQNARKKPSAGLYQWLKQNYNDIKRIPFGSEFSELDVDLDYYKIHHTILDQVGHPISSIIFGEKGSGKTATAYILLKYCQTSAARTVRPESGAFPIYSRFYDSVDARTWLVDCVSRALIDFVLDNPDRFLVADVSCRFAMGKLMLTQAAFVKQLRSYFGQTSVRTNEDEDKEEMFKQLADMEVIQLRKKIENNEVLDLLRMAIPDGFDRIYFLIDISDRCSLEQAIVAIMDLSNLSLQLAKEEFFFKIFAPIEIRSKLGDISMFEQLQIVWNENQLLEMLKRRFERFEGFCDQAVKNKKPSEALVKASQNSPRRLIHYGNSLIQYAEANLGETGKLPLEAFSEIFSARSKTRKL